MPKMAPIYVYTAPSPMCACLLSIATVQQPISSWLEPGALQELMVPQFIITKVPLA